MKRTELLKFAKAEKVQVYYLCFWNIIEGKLFLMSRNRLNEIKDDVNVICNIDDGEEPPITRNEVLNFPITTEEEFQRMYPRDYLLFNGWSKPNLNNPHEVEVYQKGLKSRGES